MPQRWTGGLDGEMCIPVDLNKRTENSCLGSEMYGMVEVVACYILFHFKGNFVINK